MIPTHSIKADITVVGAGPIGYTAALLAAREGFDVTLVGPDISDDETRTAALLRGSVRLMRHLNVWTEMERHGAPLRAMRLIDDTGRLFRAPTVTFEASEIGADAFGVNIPVGSITAALAEAVSGAPQISRVTASVTDVETDAESISVTLENGERLAARLLIAADGRRSICREKAGISIRTRLYPQSAFVLNLRHDRDHRFISTEFHRKSGPFTLVPLPGRRTSLVCVVPPHEVEDLKQLNDAALSDVLTRRSMHVLGRLSPDGPSRAYPIGSHNARAFGAGRTVLVGEAAHVMPPIGAQGLNLGLRDVATVADLLADRHPSSDLKDIVAVYDSARGVDIRTRTAAVHMLNRSLLSGFLGYQGIRSVGLHALKSVAPLRHLVMREGVQPSYATPSLMRGDNA